MQGETQGEKLSASGKLRSMDLRDVYDSMLTERIGPALGAHGFKRIRNRFARCEPSGWQLIDFQASQFGSRDAVRFTVNLAVAYLSIRGERDDWDENRPPAEANAHVRLRLGELTSGREDRWWDVDQSTNVDELATELLGLLETKGLGWLDERATIDALVDRVRSNVGTLRAYELAHLVRTLEKAGEFSAAQLAKAELERRHPGREP